VRLIDGYGEVMSNWVAIQDPPYRVGGSCPHLPLPRTTPLWAPYELAQLTFLVTMRTVPLCWDPVSRTVVPSMLSHILPSRIYRVNIKSDLMIFQQCTHACSFCMNFLQLLSKKLYTLPPSFVEIHNMWKWQIMLYFLA